MARKIGDYNSINDIPDKVLKNIIADRARGMSYSALERRYGLNHETCKKICDTDQFGDEFNKAKEKIRREAAKNTADVIKHMQEKQNAVNTLIDKFMLAMSDENKVKNSDLRTLATSMGIIIDKYLAIKPPETNTSNLKIEIVSADPNDIDKFSN